MRHQTKTRTSLKTLAETDIIVVSWKLTTVLQKSFYRTVTWYLHRDQSQACWRNPWPLNTANSQLCREWGDVSNAPMLLCEEIAISSARQQGEFNILDMIIIIRRIHLSINITTPYNYTTGSIITTTLRKVSLYRPRSQVEVDIKPHILSN